MRPLAAFFAGLVLAVAWIGGFAALAADTVTSGQSVVALFPPSMPASEVLRRFEAAAARQFEPLAANAWLVQASTEEGVARSLRSEGALLVLAAKGPLHFALGCATP